MIARAILKILPIKKSAQDVETKSFGNIRPDDVDWDKLQRGASKLLLNERKFSEFSLIMSPGI